jgi:hypothetical protein
MMSFWVFAVFSEALKKSIAVLMAKSKAASSVLHLWCQHQVGREMSQSAKTHRRLIAFSGVLPEERRGLGWSNPQKVGVFA